MVNISNAVGRNQHPHVEPVMLAQLDRLQSLRDCRCETQDRRKSISGIYSLDGTVYRAISISN